MRRAHIVCLNLHHRKANFSTALEQKVQNNHVFEGLIRSLCKEGRLNEAIKIVEKLDKRKPFIWMNAFHCLLDTCALEGNIVSGLEIHYLIIKHGFSSNAFIARRLIRMFVACESLSNANEVFSQLVEQSVFTWCSIILAHMRLGNNIEQTLELFRRMHLSNVMLDSHTYVVILKACSKSASLSRGKIFHLYILQEISLQSNVVVGNALISLYISCGVIDDARKVFIELQERDVVSWNTMIGGFSSLNEGSHEALNFFWQMQMEGIEADRVTYIHMLRVCTYVESLTLGKLIHGLLLEHGIASNEGIVNALIDMYARLDNLEEACKIFRRIKAPSLVTWCALIDAHGQQGLALEALELFEEMQAKFIDPDEILLVTILRPCTEARALDHGRHIHACIIKKGYVIDAIIGDSLVTFYCRSGKVNDARVVFDALHEVNAVTWSTIITGYAQKRQFRDALFLFSKMQYAGVCLEQNTYLSVLKLCTCEIDVSWGMVLHDQIVKIGLDTNVFIACALMKAYIRSGSLSDARLIFNKSSKQDVTIWNVMLSGYAQHDGVEALHFFVQMHEKGHADLLNAITFSSVLKACCVTGALRWGRIIHSYILERGVQADTHLGSGLIMMYAMCGVLQDGCKAFEDGPKDAVSSWNAIITGCAQHQDYDSARQYFDLMLRRNMKPNNATFASLLSSCNVRAAIQLFKEMMNEYHLLGESNHYDCFINLLGRGGYLSDAENILLTIPMLPSSSSLEVDDTGWISLLNNCKAHGNVKLGEGCFDHWVLRHGKNAAGYLLMSDIYVDKGMFENAEKIEKLRNGVNAWKKPGKACLEVYNDVYEFVVGDASSPPNLDIRDKFLRLKVKLKDEGYFPNFHSTFLSDSMILQEVKQTVAGNQVPLLATMS